MFSTPATTDGDNDNASMENKDIDSAETVTPAPEYDYGDYGEFSVQFSQLIKGRISLKISCSVYCVNQMTIIKCSV